jgi:hypothetical protein
MTISASLIYAWCSLHGYQPMPQCAALVDLALEESGLRPSIISRHGDVGLFQWRDTRRQALARFALWRHRPWTDPDTQLDFMDTEWRAMPGSSTFFAARTKAAAYYGFCRHFLRRAC